MTSSVSPALSFNFDEAASGDDKEDEVEADEAGVSALATEIDVALVEADAQEVEDGIADDDAVDEEGLSQLMVKVEALSLAVSPAVDKEEEDEIVEASYVAHFK